MTAATAPIHRLDSTQHRDRGLTIIGVFKLVKAALLVATGVAVLLHVHDDPVRVLETWAAHVRIDPYNRLIHAAIEKTLGLSPKKLEAVGIGTFFYAAVFAVEGTGLLLGKRWAEYVTLAVTVSFIPFEVFEIVEHASVVKALVTAVNIAIAVYLAVRLRTQHRR